MKTTGMVILFLTAIAGLFVSVGYFFMYWLGELPSALEESSFQSDIVELIPGLVLSFLSSLFAFGIYIAAYRRTPGAIIRLERKLERKGITDVKSPNGKFDPDPRPPIGRRVTVFAIILLGFAGLMNLGASVEDAPDQPTSETKATKTSYTFWRTRTRDDIGVAICKDTDGWVIYFGTPPDRYYHSSWRSKEYIWKKYDIRKVIESWEQDGSCIR